MAELFTRTEVEFGGAMHAQVGIINNDFLTGILMQNLGLQYQQNVTRVYELGRFGQKIRVFFIGGRAQGTLSAAHIVGPGFAMKAFYDNFGDVCSIGTNHLNLQLGPNVCNAVGSAANATALGLVTGGVVGAAGAAAKATINLSYRARYCVLVSIGLAVGAQDFVINENSQIMFAGLEYNQ